MLAIIIGLVIYRFQDNLFSGEKIYVQIEETISFPISINLYENEYIELTPHKNSKEYTYDSKSPDNIISIDSLVQFLRYKSPLQITEYEIFLVHKYSNEKSKIIPVNLAYVLVD